MLAPRARGAFKRDMKACSKKHWDMAALRKVMDLICTDAEETRAILVREYRDHALRGNWKGTRECHVADLGDWVLIYAVYREEGVVEFIGTGMHDQFFKSSGNAERWKR